MVWVNSMWLISLVLSLTSALIATLLQQWARRYVETPHRPGEPKDRARVRSFLFHGTELYKMRFAVQIAPTLLHFSVYLFFAGLVVLFHTIDKNVAIAVDVSVGVFAAAYIVLSILPCLDVACPYRTPMSYILWYPLHAILSFAALCMCWLVDRLYECLVQHASNDEDMTYRRRTLVDWLESREKAARTHWRYFKDGLGESIINHATKMEGDGDRKIVARMFNLLAPGDKSKFLKLVASIPREKVLELIPLIESGRIVFQESLLILLRTCTAGAHITGLDEDVRKRSLLVCLDAVHHIAKAPSVPDLDSFLAKFADISLMRALWGDDDTAISVTSRSICALLAKKLVRVSATLEVSQQIWLHDITDETPGAIYDADFELRDRMNIKSFVYEVLSNYEGNLSTEDAKSFKETLGILLDVGADVNFDTNHSQDRIFSQVVIWRHQDNSERTHHVIGKLHTIFPFLFHHPPPPPPFHLPPLPQPLP